MALIRANPLLWRWARFAGLDGALLIGAAQGVLPAVVAGTALHKEPQALASSFAYRPSVTLLPLSWETSSDGRALA